MLLCACAYGVKSEISLDAGDSASNAVVKRSVLSVFSAVQRCAKCVCLYTMDLLSGGKNTLLLHVTVCEQVVSRLNKDDDAIEWNFMKIFPPRNEELVAPLIHSSIKFIHCIPQNTAFLEGNFDLCIKNVMRVLDPFFFVWCRGEGRLHT